MKHCDRCHTDFTGDLAHCPLCAAKLSGDPSPSPFPIGRYRRLRHTVRLTSLVFVLVTLSASVALGFAFGIPALIATLLAGLVVLGIIRLLLTQGSLGVKLAKYLSLS